jgi:uncharacterized membrane protein YqhA
MKDNGGIMREFWRLSRYIRVAVILGLIGVILVFIVNVKEMGIIETVGLFFSEFGKSRW